MIAVESRGNWITRASVPVPTIAPVWARKPRRFERLLSLFDFENEAHTRIPHGAWERISGGSADEITLRWNREAYDHIRLKPRILVDCSCPPPRSKSGRL
jgi:4-hydroxymandelate oxidase